jgi:ribosomal protein S18 acetylase RimI-like enzyme
MTRAPAGQVVAPHAGAGVVVRQATPADVDVVVELRLALLREYDGHAVFGRLHADAEQRAPRLCAEQMASPRDAFFLAEVDGVPVGLLRCTESKASPLLQPERFAYVSSVYVRPAFRRRGLVRKLLAAADAWCAAHGLTEMRLHNVPGHVAAATWAPLGFGVVEEVRTRQLGEA